MLGGGDAPPSSVASEVPAHARAASHCKVPLQVRHRCPGVGHRGAETGGFNFRVRQDGALDS
jgi:hypothetical protein